MPGDLIDLDQIRTAECTNQTVISCKSSPQTETCLKDWTLEVSASHPAVSCISSPQTERCLNHCTTETTCFISPWNCRDKPAIHKHGSDHEKHPGTTVEWQLIPWWYIGKLFRQIGRTCNISLPNSKTKPDICKQVNTKATPFLFFIIPSTFR